MAITYHGDSTIVHRLHRWEFANAAARLAKVDFAARDVGRRAFDLDTKTFHDITEVVSGVATWASQTTVQDVIDALQGYTLAIYDESNILTTTISTGYVGFPVYDETDTYAATITLVPDDITAQHTYVEYTSNHTLTLTDIAHISGVSPIVAMNVSSANTVTVPPAASVAFPVGAKVDIEQIGTGSTTIVAGSGVTVVGTPGLKLRSRYSPATLIKKDTNVWHLYGDLAL